MPGCERRRWLEKRPALKRAFRVSLNSNAVIIIHRTTPRRIVPVPGIVVAVLRRSFELIFGNAGAIAAKVGVVLQRLPGQGIVVVADPEETAETQDSVRDLAGHLIDHDALDRSDLGIVSSIHGRSFDLIAAD